jgi:nucleotide-binding universal stress UspA family protein
VPECLATIRIK